MNLPFEVPDPAFKKTTGKLESDEGIRFSTAEGLANLAPVLPDGTVTYGGQTHPSRWQRRDRRRGCRARWRIEP